MTICTLTSEYWQFLPVDWREMDEVGVEWYLQQNGPLMDWSGKPVKYDAAELMLTDIEYNRDSSVAHIEFSMERKLRGVFVPDYTIAVSYPDARISTIMDLEAALIDIIKSRPSGIVGGHFERGSRMLQAEYFNIGSFELVLTYEG
ncbi:MAG: hypothetical protein KJ601_07765 [Nanoarchaeota archaeon]|nr:hypothetical protein [Nanoarchaeota archaeon]MBU1704478.1 hypothetical protein [Nanoarchaeota archaeon]